MIELLEVLRELPILVKAAIMGVVEGLTEFLPVSSTGHLILAGALLGFDDARAKVFDLAIQTGAMVAVIWVYRERFQRLAQGQAWEFLGRIPAAIRHPGQRRALFQDPSWQFVRHLAIAFMPAAILGLAFGGWIKAFLFAPIPVAIVLILGGVVILLVERWVAIRPQHVRVRDVDQMTNRDALRLGIAQAFALIPGTSRSGATIIGGMIFGLSRKSATEFSFFLAVPTLMAAGAYDLLKNWRLLHLVLQGNNVVTLLFGMLVSFVVALLAIRFFICFLKKHGFFVWGIYRIVIGLVILLLISKGVII